jgi:nitroimidazol reductase NimA-like FMN-containing flavoprotein (pyridoxamine 5'-phosphate oxidase superfamily)
MLTNLSSEVALQVLQSAQVGRLGCIVNGEPYVVPINFKLVGDCIYSHSLPGLKIVALRKNPRACIQVDQIESELRWRSVIAYGTFEEVPKSPERTETLNQLLRQFPLLTPVESAITDEGGGLEVILYRIRVQRITGVEES